MCAAQVPMSAVSRARQDRVRSSTHSGASSNTSSRRLSGGSDTARIIRYGLRHWDGLTRFLDDGRIELDTNIVERSMRPQALTRKKQSLLTNQSLFAADRWTPGGVRGGDQPPGVPSRGSSRHDE
jgi:hypothetical protein